MSPLMQKVLEFIVSKHAGQYRKHSGLPYVFHPIEVCKTLSDSGISNETLLNAALCHDILEDTDTTFNELSNLIGSEAAFIVLELTYDENFHKSKDEYLASFSRKSNESLIIKTVDRYCNIMDFKRASNPYWKKYYEKSKVIFNYYSKLDKIYIGVEKLIQSL